MHFPGNLVIKFFFKDLDLNFVFIDQLRSIISATSISYVNLTIFLHNNLPLTAYILPKKTYWLDSSNWLRNLLLWCFLIRVETIIGKRREVNSTEVLKQLTSTTVLTIEHQQQNFNYSEPKGFTVFCKLKVTAFGEFFEGYEIRVRLIHFNFNFFHQGSFFRRWCHTCNYNYIYNKKQKFRENLLSDWWLPFWCNSKNTKSVIHEANHHTQNQVGNDVLCMDKSKTIRWNASFLVLSLSSDLTFNVLDIYWRNRLYAYWTFV